MKTADEGGEESFVDQMSNKSHDSIISDNPHDMEDSASNPSSVDLLRHKGEVGSSNSKYSSVETMPLSPRLSDAKLLYRGTSPLSSRGDNEFVMYSDSDDGASQSSLDLRNEEEPMGSSSSPSSPSSPSSSSAAAAAFAKRNINQQLRKWARSLSSSDDEEEEEMEEEEEEAVDEDDEDDAGEINVSQITPTSSSKTKKVPPEKELAALETPKMKTDLAANETPRRRKSSTPTSRTSSRRRRSRKSESESLPETEDTPKLRKSRRKSKDTKEPRELKEASEKSHRSFDKPGTGYTSMPPSGKVFRNLLILEESMREQVRQQRAMRRKYLIFLSILCSIIAALTHHLFILDASVSSRGTLRLTLQFLLISTIMTLLLYHLSGEYQKTIVLPRKFLSSTNKGLRQLNVRLVKIKTPFADKVTDLIREVSLSTVIYCLWLFHLISPSSIQNRNSKIEVFLVTFQSQCQPRIGIADVKLLLNARVFNIDIREGWEIYRSEFWINEGVRRRNNLLTFITGSKYEKSKLVKRRKRKSSSIPPQSIPSKLSEQNLMKLSAGFQDTTTTTATATNTSGNDESSGGGFSRSGSPLKYEASNS
ncbi:uncharacterized protein LODBEIA_P01070 [Lodderomyces beijingensis]|uniref:Uncharacterized protein n=1 Tax=Lodderomyces beijingensis TaxID=1775926 RepID=A0ABP0ZE79_9ASCO